MLARRCGLWFASAVTAVALVGLASPASAAGGDAAAQAVAHFWLDAKGANLASATPLTFTPAVSTPPPAGTGGFALDGTVLPIPPRGLGKVYFVGEDGAPHWCTGMAVAAPSGNVVATSGRCGFDDQSQPHENWVFVPDGAARPEASTVYVGAQLFAPYDFLVYEDFDAAVTFGAVHDGVRLSGKKLRTTGRLADATGSQAISFTEMPVGSTVRLRGHPTGWAIAPWLRLFLQGGQFDQTFRLFAPTIKGEELQGVRGSNPFATSLGSAWFSSYDARTRTGTIAGITLGTVADASGVAISVTPPLGSLAQEAYQGAAAVPSTPIA